MRRLAVVLVVALMAVALPAATLAARPSAGCGNAASGFHLVDRAGRWDSMVVGFGEEGITVYDSPGVYSAQFDQFARDSGFDSAAALHDWVLGAHWAAYDKNGDGYLCMKDLPNTPGIPGYSFGLTDNTANAG